ncbi:unnamed protein product [Calicophoron daubneyi]|uniref:Golgi SNAP receptor complex member 1 n=1 Tax=Calicophoron daubneyi TaxID=300641 RepID=A0AAV2T9G5_CALDB
MHRYAWDELRRQARALENELDTKLASFGTLSGRASEPAMKAGGANGSPRFASPGQKEGFKFSPQPEDFSQSYAQASSEIEQLIQRLTQVNDQMTELVRETDPSSAGADHSARPSSAGGGTPTPPIGLTAGQMSQLHTAKRHREILRDYTQEFRQTKAKILAFREREDLLGSVYRDLVNREGASGNAATGDGISVSATGAGNRATLTSQSSSTRLLMDEQEKYHHSSRLMDEHLAAASTIRAALRAQRKALLNASSGLHNLTARFPRVKQLISKIDWRHRQDSLVLGLVIAFCVAFLIIYKIS